MRSYSRRSYGVFIGLVLSLAAGHLRGEEPVRSLNAAFLNYPPMAYLDANGEAAGSVIELTNRVAAESGLEINWKSYPIRRIYKSLRTGEIDFWPGSQAIPALSDFTVETGSIGIDITLCAFSLGNTPPITDPEDLREHRLVLIRGYTYRAQLDQIFAETARRPIVTPDHASALQLLQKGRADYLISYNDPIGQVLQENPKTGSRCDVLDTWPLVYVVSNRIPDALQVLEALNAGLHRVHAGRAVAGASGHPQPPLDQQDKSAE